MEVVSSSRSPEPDMLNFIYACSICGVTFADTYEGHEETVQGFSDGINPKDRLVTKLFLSSCCHVFCVEHLQDHGVPFHPAGQKPRAPCPYCVQKKGDSTIKDLYSIRGFGKDEADPEIPKIWFSAPPMSLDGKSAEMEALRFQYLALARYCQTTYRTRKPLADALKKSKQDLATMQTRTAEEQAKVLSLQNENKTLRGAAHRASEMNTLRTEVQRLQYLEQERDLFYADREEVRLFNADIRDLGVFRKNKTAILRYLKLLPRVVEQNTQMKERLSSVGFAMALEPVPNYTQLNSDDYNQLEGIAEAYAEDDRRFQNSSSTQTAGRSAHTSGFPFDSSDRPLKRQRVDSPVPQDMQIDPPSSRDRMPPPPSKPLSKIRSVRGLIPTIRKKLSSNRLLPKKARKDNGDVQMYDNGNWRGAMGSHPTPYRNLSREPTYMSGAPSLEDRTQQSQLMASAAAGSNASRFSFRAASPVKLNDGGSRHQPVQLPQAPSYLNLMDGLVGDNGIELGLKDPRENAPDTSGPTISTPQVQRQSQEASSQPRWRQGHAFLQQSPRGLARQTNDQQHFSPIQKSRGFFSRAQYDTFPGVTTPEQSQSQQSAHQVQAVVSPFFGCSQYDAPMPQQPRITETQTSSPLFAASQSQRHPISPNIAGWRKSSSLNELSFMSSPLNSRNEPIMYRRQHCLSHRSSTTSHRGSNTLVPQSGIHGYPVYSRGYSPSTQPRLTFPRHQHRQMHSQALPVRPFSQVSPSRIGHLPSALPSAVSSQSPTRGRAHWDMLQRAGVRSSREPHGNLLGSLLRPF